MPDLEREVYREVTEYGASEPEEMIESEDLAEDDDYFAAGEHFSEDKAEGSGKNEARMNRRRARIRGRKRRRRTLAIVLIIAAFAALATMCGRDMIKLQAENAALRRQQKKLIEQRDRLMNEVERSGQREYIQEQARKQLHLLNPGELLFTFDEEEETDE